MKRMQTVIFALCVFCCTVFVAAVTPEVDDIDLSLGTLFPSDSQTWVRPTAETEFSDLIATAVRLNACYGTDAIPESVINSVSATENGGIARKDAIRLLHAAVPDDALIPINTVYGVKNLSAADEAYDAVAAFLRAGVLDDNAFFGDEPIIEHELHTVLERLAFPSRRARFALGELAEEKQAYLLCYADSMNHKNDIESGWEYDNRAGRVKRTLAGNGTLYDLKDDERSRLVRRLNTITDDSIELFCSITFLSNANGVSLEFCGEDDEIVYKLVVADGKFCIENADGSNSILCDCTSDDYWLRITVDLSSGVSRTAINNVFYGEHPLRGNKITCFALCTGVGEHNTVTLNNCYMYGNYAVYEDFSYSKGAKPYDMSTSGNVTFGSETVLGEASSVSRRFSPMAHTVAFATNTLLADGSSDMTYALTHDSTDIVRITTQNGKFYANGVDLGKTFSDKLWWKLRIEADFDQQKAAVKINAKTLATVDFLSQTDFADGIRFENTGKDNVRVDDIKVFHVVEYDVPAPAKPSGEENYVIGINVCSLWVNGEHSGWSRVSPFDDIKPVLGYYDEGLPETADWENKYMADHGIDFQAFCWFANQTNAAMKTGDFGKHLEEAYLYSKYKSDVKFALLWETANAAIPATEQAFYDYYIPYWQENYFSDPDYIVLDNGGNGVMMMSVFGAEKLINAFGTPEEDTGEIPLKRMLDALDTCAVELGYDGMIVSACSAYQNNDTIYLGQYGFDAWNAYNWGTDGSSLTMNKSCNRTMRGRVQDVYVIPTVSVGFNNIAWNPDDRHPLIEQSDYRLAHEWVRDEYLPAYAQNDGIAWNDTLVWLSTWNEYGEGTYIMPCEGLNGFGYLDALRTVYTNGGAHSDVVPTEAQKNRINHNYPQDYRLLCAYGDYAEPTIPQTLPTTAFYFTSGGNSYTDCFSLSSCNYVSRSSDGTAFRSSSTNADVIFYLKSDMWSGLAADDVKAIHVVASGIPTGQKMQLFYQTANAPELSESNSISVYSSSTDERDYVFDFTGNGKWGGAVKALRLDPLQVKDTVFTIRSISFEMSNTFKRVASFNDLIVNDVLLDTHIRGIVDQNGIPYYPFEPTRNLLPFYLYCYFDWDYDTKVLNLYRDGKTFTFTVGSDICMIDGTPYTLEGTVWQEDNIPMLPIRGLCGALGLSCVKDGDVFRVETPEKYLFDAMNFTPVVGNWTFNVIGSTQGWTSSTATLVAMGEYLRVTSLYSTDPMMHSVDNLGLSCEDYPIIEIKCRGNANGKSVITPGIYFTTMNDASETQSKFVGKTVPCTPESGEWQTVTLDMSANSNWTGTLKRLRFDPFNATGTMEIAYIRLLDIDGNPIPLVFH